jgi:ribosomal protein L34E
MPLPKNRSTSVRRIHVRVPKRGSVIHYRRRIKGKKHACAICGGALQSVAARKTPNRPYGGHLCTSCTSRVLAIKSRLAGGSMQPSEIDVRMLKYVKQ